MGRPGSPGLPMGRAVALLDGGETFHGQTGLSGWHMGCSSPGRLSRATSARSPSHITGKGWWVRAQGLPDPIPLAWLWENPLGWWLGPLGTAGLLLRWSWGSKGC